MLQANTIRAKRAIILLRAGVTPDSILRLRSKPELDSSLQDRQYGIATFATGHVQLNGEALREYRGERSADGVLEVIMPGLKAGADAGGDSRCGDQRATAAFLAVAKPGDNPNWPYLTLRVVDTTPGSRVRAVDLLQTRLSL